MIRYYLRHPENEEFGQVTSVYRGGKGVLVRWTFAQII